MRNFDQFEISTTEMNNVEGGTFGLLGLLGGCFTPPSCTPKPVCTPPPVVCTPPPVVCTPPPPVCPPAPVCTPKPSFCLPKITISISIGGRC